MRARAAAVRARVPGDAEGRRKASLSGHWASKVLGFADGSVLLWLLLKPGGGLRSEQGQEHDWFVVLGCHD
jgi:hypothetical protein